MKSLALVIPVFNEVTHLVNCLRHICNTVTGSRYAARFVMDVVVVDDGSTDGSIDNLAANFQLGQEIHYVRLNTNYGKEAAICAGLELVKNHAAVIVLDADLQHPPELIAQMVEQWEAGNLVVTARKSDRGHEAVTKSLGGRLFYSLFSRCSGMDLHDDSDFKLLDRKVVNHYLALPERTRFFRGLINWMNFPGTYVTFEVPASAKQKSSWSLGKLFRYAVHSVTAFTALPLQIVTGCGVFTFLLALVLGGKSLYDKFTGASAEGFPTVILLLLIIGSILMFSLGLIGVYIARIYEEIKARPSYYIDYRSSKFGKLLETDGGESGKVS